MTEQGINRRRVDLDGIVYEAWKDPMLSSRPWYAAVVDPEHGATLDARVPDGTFRTMRECHEAIRSHHAWRAKREGMAS